MTLAETKPTGNPISLPEHFHLSTFMHYCDANRGKQRKPFSNFLKEEIARQTSFVMADPSVLDSALGWVSSIEYLVSLPEVDPSIIHDLIEAAPDFPDELGKNMREVVALRCLESLFGYRNGLPQEVFAFAPTSQIVFDLSESCEDVLQSIMRELSVLDLKMAGPQLLKWDIQSFIVRKRDSMPKCFLEQLKDAFLEGTHPCAASLKELSGLHTNNENDKTATGDGDPNLVALGIDGCNQTMAPEVRTLPLSLKNEDRVAGDDLHDRSVLPSKRGRSELANENVSGNYIEDQVCTDDCGDGHPNSKRRKQDFVCANQSEEQISIPLQGKDLMEGSPQRMSTCAEEDVHMEKEPAVVESEVRRSLDSDQHGTPQADDINETLHNECISASNKVPQDTTPDSQDLVEEPDHAEHRLSNCEPSVEIQQKACAGETNNDNDNHNQPNMSNTASLSKVDLANNGTSHFFEDISSDSDDDYERVDVGMKKDDFLNSQCGYDSSAALDGTCTNLCVRCCKDGPVLACSIGGCPLVVHESCLGSSPRFNESGEFFCPFCAYSVAISNYIEAKNRASSARKELTAFVNFRLKHLPKELGRNLHRGRQSRSQNGYVDLHRGDDNFVARECNDANDGEHVCEATDNQFLVRRGKKQLVDPPASDMHQPMELSQRLCSSRPGCSQNGDVDLPHADEHFVARDCNQANDVEHACEATKHQFPERGGKKQLVDPPPFDMNANSRGEDEPSVVGGVIHISSRQKKRGEEGQQCPSTKLDRQQDQVCSDPKGKEDNAIQDKETVTQRQGEGESEKRVLRQKVTSSPEKPVIPHLRRRKLPWTAKEEELLREGVQKFSSAHERSMPWKRILEYGASVFSHNSRTTIDLKDKWRNMCKRSLKSK